MSPVKSVSTLALPLRLRYAETRCGPQGVGWSGCTRCEFGSAHVWRPSRAVAPCLPPSSEVQTPDGPSVSEVTISRGNPEAARVGGVEGDVGDADGRQLAIAHG